MLSQTIKINFIAAIILLCSACSSALDQLPEDLLLVDNYYQTESSIETTVTAAYDILQTLYSYDMILWGEIPSDNTYVQAPNSNGAISPLEDFTWTSTTGFVKSIWDNSYKGILYANTVLEVASQIAFADEAVKRSRIGEMHLIRGLLYDNLTTIYGDVPLALQTGDPSNAFSDVRTPIQEVFTQIESDLNEAIALLPDVNTAGRPSSHAARALLARHYMKRNDFAKAETLLQAVIASGQFAIVPLDQLYGVNNKGNKEEVFSIQYASDLNGQTEGNSYYNNFTRPDNSGGQGAMAMEQALYSLYEVADLRRSLINQSGNVYYIDKWTPSPNSNNSDGGDNHFLIRYADVLLRYAECLNENGKTSEAAQHLNVIRTRAGLEATTAVGQEAMRQAIAIERRLELVGEGHRWPDLLRTGNAIATMNAFFQHKGRNITVSDYRLLAPLPQAEVDITAMEQNPGY